MSVIALHCNGYVHSCDVADEDWWLHVLYEVAFFNAVPIFFMLSGATLLGYHKKYDTCTFFKKRFRKAFLPFLFWSVVCFILAVLFAGVQPSLGFIANRILTCRIPLTDYWFFLPLFLLYLFMPFLSVMVSNLRNNQILCLIVMIVVLQAVVQPVTMRVGVVWCLPIGDYVAYALLGYYLSRTSWERNKKVVFCIAVLALLLMTARYVGVLNSDHKSPVLWSYLSLYGYFGSVAIFLIIKKLCANHGGYILPFSAFVRSVSASATLRQRYH